MTTTIQPDQQEQEPRTNKLYRETVEVDTALREYLVQCCKNHLVLYNDVLEFYRANRNVSYRELKMHATGLIEKNRYGVIIRDILFNDIYYMFKRHDFRQKLLTSIHYLTIITGAYSNSNTMYDEHTLHLSFKNAEGKLTLPKPLPPLEEGVRVYMNLSYSGGSGTFELSVFSM